MNDLLSSNGATTAGPGARDPDFIEGSSASSNPPGHLAVRRYRPPSCGPLPPLPSPKEDIRKDQCKPREYRNDEKPNEQTHEIGHERHNRLTDVYLGKSTSNVDP